MSERPLIVGNWKMHLTPAETTAYIERFLPLAGSAMAARDVALAPPSTSLHAAAAALAGSGVHLAAQNSHWEDEGPYTGEVSPRMLEEIGCRYVIIGHSERRGLFGETDRRVNQKVRAVLRCGMTPIVCVGEQSSDKAAGRTREVVDAQLTLSLANIRLEGDERLVVAYEPVWAIGTGRNASPGDAVEVHNFIRNELTATYGRDRAERTRILYGGSVSASNAGEFLSAPGVGGVLVGGASLDPETFSAICRSA
ncbi:MAG: triose-phosphate isomerase [Acidobacteria bacterium]|nr:triose-phosphate isomerase [Acidobacteriota bacterium]